MHKIKKLREILKKTGLDGMIIPMSDPFQNEFIPEYYQRIKYLSGFTGSLGAIIVLEKKACLFVDGRYTIQAANETDPNLFEIQEYSIKSMMRWVSQNTKKNLTLGYDPWDYTVTEIKTLEEKGIEVTFVPLNENPIDTIWEDHPKITKTPIFLYPESYTGLSWQQKVKLICDDLKKKQLDALFLTSSASICWLLNIRGQDIPFTPISLCYALVHASGKVDLFAYLENLSPKIKSHFKKAITFHALSGKNLEATLPHLTKDLRVGYTEHQAPIKIKTIMEPHVSHLENLEDPCVFLKACKTKTEISHIKKAHLWDGIALTRFFHWLEVTVPVEKLTEFDATCKIDSLRQENKHCKGLSFPTIAGINANASIVHHHATEKSPVLHPKDIFLCDSGGQYFEGTTDVTRTTCLGGEEPTPKQKDIFTRILKGLIALSTVRFPRGTKGGQLDILARQYLWEIGLDYAHATGHGVGQYSNVHEGPHNISHRPSKTPLMPGMVVSNEPGCYLKGEFGIRIENLMVVQESKAKDLSGNPLLEFETLTLCPIEKSCIDVTLLSPKEINWINAYHKTVWEKLHKFLNAPQKEWLRKATQPLAQEPGLSHQDSMRDSMTGSMVG